MKEGRTKKSVRNTASSFIFKIIDVVLAFVLRTIFIKTLGMSYLGISGLFANILTVLSLMDLGIGGAIVFSLYKPLAENDYSKIAALMHLYKKVYMCVGILISVIGIALTPFLEYIINIPEKIDHIYWIYWITIANTAASYFLAYRRSLLIADQRLDINNKNQIIFKFTRFFILSLVLLLWHNYILFISLDVLNTIASNVHITLLVKKRYANIESAQAAGITKEEKRNIIRYMSSGILSKIGQTVVNSTDNILISAFVGTIFVGIYSNYSMITANLHILVYLLFSSITASVGNYAVTSNDAESEKLFRRVTFLNFAISFFLSICTYSLITPFIKMWAGEDYVLSDLSVTFVILNFYFSTIQEGVGSFLGAVGKMFYFNRFRSLIEGCVNLVVSVVLVKFTPLGITGVFIGTTVCFLFGRLWMDAYTLYRHWFHLPVTSYYRTFLLRFLLTVATATVCKILSNYFFSLWGINLLTWCIAGISVFLVSGTVFFLLFRSSEDYQFLIQLMSRIKPKWRRKETLS